LGSTRVTFWLKATFAPETINPKDSRDSFLLDLLPAIREAVANNVFDSIPQRRLYRKTPLIRKSMI
jgi:hypothetical protein